MGISLGTGFLYNWGEGISGQQFIPRNITGQLFSGLAVGENFNATAAVTEEVSIFAAPPGKKKNFGKFEFQIFNPSASVSPLNSFEKISTIYSTGLDLDGNTGSKDNFLLISTLSKEENIVINRGLLVSGVSGDTSLNTFINSKRNSRNYLSSNSWLEYSGAFFDNNFTGFENDDAGIILRDFALKSNEILYEINYGVDPSFVTGSGRKAILFQNLKIDYPTGRIFDASNKKAWASYQVNFQPKLSGQDEKLENSNFNVLIPGTVNRSENVFAYAFEFVDIVTLRDSGTLIISGDQENPFEYLLQLQDPKIFTGFDTSFSNYLGYCFTRKPCPDVEEKEINDEIFCWTGSGSEPPPTSRENATGRAYLRFVSGIREQFKNQGVQRSAFDGFSDLTLSSGILVSGLFKQQTGSIIYNSFFSGDTISFNLYPFNYTGFYQSYHLGNNPLFPGTGFTLRYPQDFSGIDSLVNILNNRLSGISYPVWYPYDCLSGESTGIYITGGLMSFEKDFALETGDKNYNNIIKFRSLRNYESGFQLSLNLVDREEYIQDLELQYFRQGFSYLLPDVIELQGRTGDQWIILDRRENLYNQLTGLERTLKPLNANPELFLDESTEDWLSSQEVTGTGNGFTFFDFEEIFLQGGFLELNKFRQQGFNVGKVPPYCPGGQGEAFEKDISIVVPTGWPTGVDGCEFKLPEVEEPCPEPIIPFCDESKGCVLISSKEDGCDVFRCECPKDPRENLELSLSVLRTGWSLELTGKYLNCLTGPDFDPNKIKFPEYRFVAKNFSGLKPIIQNQYLIPKNEIFFTNVNLFSVKPSGIGLHEGQSQCLIGADYELSIRDIVAFPFSGIFEYTIPSEDFSGVYKALNQILTYAPDEEERNVKFIRRSGKIVGNVTGLINGDFTGRNTIQHTFTARNPSGYFYKPESREVYFSETVSEFFVRSGILKTGVFALKEEVVNFELLAGGRLDAAPEYVEISGSGVFTGTLLNQRYFQTGATGIYNLTGSISGFSTSGFFDVLIPTGTRYTGDGFIDLFVSGRTFSGLNLIQSGFDAIVKAFPSEDFVSGNLSELNSLISGDFITSSNYIFRSPEEFAVFIIGTGVSTGTSLNPVFPFTDETSVTGLGEYRDPNGFVFRNTLQTLMTGNFFARRSDNSCFDFWPNTSYPLYTIATISGLTSQSFISGVTGINNISGNLVINKGSFGLISGFDLAGFATGSSISFTKTDYGNEIDIIDSGLQITRDEQYSIYNPVYQTDAFDNSWSNFSGGFFSSPAYTLWNRDGWTGLNSFKNRQYTGLYFLWGGGGIGVNIVNEELIMWDFLNNKYYLIKFSQWTQGGNGGGFSYVRTQIFETPSKEIYFELPFLIGETILIENKNIFNSGEERIKGLYKIQDIVSGDQNSNFVGPKGIFSCLRGGNIIFNSPTEKNVYITSTGNLIGRPVFASIDLMNETENKPFFPIPTGFQQASGEIFFNFPFTRIFDRLSINNTTITYHPDSEFFFAPDYFNDIDSLLSIINTNPDIFNVTGQKINNTGINLLALSDFQPGDEGNTIQISTTSSSGILLSSASLTGGITFYPQMVPTSLFSGLATGKVGVTGVFTETGSGIITGLIPTFTGVRTFTGIWDLKSGIDYNFRSYFANGLLSGEKYFSTQVFEDEFNIIQLLLSYNNELNITDNISDVAELKIQDLNYDKIFPTGNPDIPGEIIFRITGINNL